MSSTTGAILMLVVGLGSAGYVTYSTVYGAGDKTREVRELLARDAEPVHVRFVTHESVGELRKALSRLNVPYRPGSKATKVALSPKVCEVHILKLPNEPKASDTFVQKQVSVCQDMLANYNGRDVMY